MYMKKVTISFVDILGCYPCLLCTIHKEDMKTPLSVRGYSPTRSLQSIYENYSKYSAAGFPRKDAQFYSNCISEPIWDIPLDQVSKTNYFTYKFISSIICIRYACQVCTLLRECLLSFSICLKLHAMNGTSNLRIITRE
jgi:hypothetical protein